MYSRDIRPTPLAILKSLAYDERRSEHATSRRQSSSTYTQYQVERYQREFMMKLWQLRKLDVY